MRRSGQLQNFDNKFLSLFYTIFVILQLIKADSFDYYDRKDRYSYDQRPQEKMKLYEYIVIIIISHLKISYLYI